MRVAGIYPQPIELDLGLDPDPDEPLGIGYVLACAEKAGHEVGLFIPVDGDWAEMERQLADFQPDVLAFSAFTKHVDIARRLAGRLRQQLHPRLLVAGGSHPTAAPLDLLGDFDVCVIGEGEETFVELLTVVEAGGDLAEIPGISYRAPDGIPRQNPRRPRIVALDELPWPVREPRLHRAEALGICYPASNVAGFASSLYSRGCPFVCSFCSSPQHWGRQVTFRSVDSVIAELVDLRDRFGVRFVSFADLTFTINRKRTVALCEGLLAADLGMHWMCETSLNTVDQDLIRLMSAAGCTKICWGVETADDDSVQAMKKRQSFEQAREVLGWAHGEGIFNWAFTMIGFPWQSEQDILAASAKLAELPIHQVRVSIATPFPGTAWISSFPPALAVPSSRFDTNHLVYQHPTISPWKMKELQQATLRQFYASAEYEQRMTGMSKRFPHLQKSIEEFRGRVGDWLGRKPAGGGHSRIRPGETEPSPILLERDRGRAQVGHTTREMRGRES
jgi:anaerobic magnesium-protoporphyrin IX monomethyl ester cyclase